MDYNDGKWHGWNGGECPVHPETEVLACFEDGIDCSANGSMPASSYDWKCTDDCKIIAFRVIKEYREPREFWICEGIEDCVMSSPFEGAIHVREVLE